MSKNQLLDMRSLILKNSNASNIGIFKNILSDLSIKNMYKPTFLGFVATGRVKIIVKKKTKSQTFTFK